jgi:hypothetical protein
LGLLRVDVLNHRCGMIRSTRFGYPWRRHYEKAQGGEDKDARGSIRHR